MSSTPAERCIAPALDAFGDHGVAVVRHLVSSGRAARLAAAFDRLFAAATPTSAVHEIVRPSLLDAAFADLLSDDAFVRPARVALGTDRIQLLQEVLLCKRPGAGGRIAWHRDASYLGYLEPTRVVSLRLALAPCTRAHGCLLVLDGSHTWAYATASRVGDLSIEDAVETLPRPLRDRMADSLAAIELGPGDASIHGPHTLHGSGPNLTREVRKTLVVHVVDAACRVVPERLPHPNLRALFPADAEGHLIGPSFPALPLRIPAREA
jgi:phytanoyl-CoA hydroxylase